MSETKKEYNIWTSFTDGLRKYFQLKGRANRYEYWGFILMSLLILVVLSLISTSITIGISAFATRSIVLLWGIYGLYVLDMLFRLFLFIPSITIAVRRLHDINRSGWWILLPLGIVLVLMLLAVVSAVLGYAGISMSMLKSLVFIISGFAIIFSIFYVLYLLCKKPVDEGNKYGEPNKDAKEDKYGIKFIWIYFCFILLSLVIIFSAPIYKGYSSAVTKYEMQRNDAEYFIPKNEYENMQTIKFAPTDDEELIIVDDEGEVVYIEENTGKNFEGNIQDYSF